MTTDLTLLRMTIFDREGEKMIDIYEKYRIVHIDGCRHYYVNLKEKEYNFENTFPYCLTIESVQIYDTSWKGMIEKLCVFLDDLFPKSIEELLSIKNSWGKQDVFSSVKKTNYTKFKTIFINTNHTSVHAMWTIQLLLQEYSVDLDKCQFIIRRLPIAEPKEIREYERNRAIETFRSFMREKYHKSEATIDGLIKNIDIINKKILPKISVGYDDIFLIESPYYFATYAGKILEYSKTKMFYNENQLKVIDYTVKKMAKFIKHLNKENRVLFGLNGSKTIDDDIDDFPDDF